jgi:hypothetical protein
LAFCSPARRAASTGIPSIRIIVECSCQETRDKCLGRVSLARPVRPATVSAGLGRPLLFPLSPSHSPQRVCGSVNTLATGTTYISRGHSCASPRVSRKSSGLKESHFPTDFTDRDAPDFRLSDHPKSTRLRATRITDRPDAITSNAAGSGNFIEVYTWANWRIPGRYAIRIRRRLECSPVTPQEQIPPRLGHVLSATKRMGYAL